MNILGNKAKVVINKEENIITVMPKRGKNK